MNFWASLEWLPGLIAIPAAWLTYLGEDFENFKNTCLRQTSSLQQYVKCPHHCGCAHRVVHRHDLSGAVGICRCHPPTCPDLPLTIEEITQWELDWRRLSFALAQALNCTPRLVDLEPPYTKQIAAWSTDAIPVILTIHSLTTKFLAAVGHLTTTQGRPFILLSPTSIHLNAVSLGLLHHARASFFGLDSIVAFDQAGRLRALKPPAELFSGLVAPTLHHPNTPSPHHSGPCYALRKHLGVWHLIFDGQEAYIRHERGLFYVHWLLYHPDECPIHAIDLMAKIPEIYRQQLGLPTLADPVTGKTVTLESGARLQERSLALDDRQSMRALYKKQQELEALLDSDSATEPEKAEALRELEQLYAWQRHQAHRSKDAAQNAANTVRQAIKRLHLKLSIPKGTQTTPDRPLHQFARHIKTYILDPSVLLSGHGGQHVETGHAGSITYASINTIRWT